MSLVSVADITHSLESGSRPKGGISAEGGVIPSLGGEHIGVDGGFRLDSPKRVSREFYRSMRTGHIEVDDILIVKDGATTGRTSYVANEFPFREAAVNEHVFCLRIDPNRAHAKFVYHFLRSPIGQMAVMSDFRGATVGGISRDFINKVRLDLPLVAEQRRIAAILDQADALRAKRREALAQLNSLTQSMFVEMFGDPVRNPKGWKQLAIGELLSTIESGWSPVCLDRPVRGGEWGVLKLGAVTSCTYDAKANKALPSGVAPDPSIEVKPGDVLFSRKNTYELVAACAYVDATVPRLMMSDLIFRFQIGDEAKLDKRYLHALLTNAKKRQQVQKLAGGSSGSMPNISKARLQGLIIELPPIDLQRVFATRTQAVESLKSTHRAALAEADALFASLQHRAFAGQL